MVKGWKAWKLESLEACIAHSLFNFLAVNYELSAMSYELNAITYEL
jgi:hypothetical protein